jgi:hypothetical protein
MNGANLRACRALLGRVNEGIYNGNFYTPRVESCGCQLESRIRGATLRAAVFLGGAVLGRAARKPVILISQAWGGSKSTSPSSRAFWNGKSRLRRSGIPTRHMRRRATRFKTIFSLQLPFPGSKDVRPLFFMWRSDAMIRSERGRESRIPSPPAAQAPPSARRRDRGPGFIGKKGGRHFLKVDTHRPLAHAAPRQAALVPLQRDLRPLRIRGESRHSVAFAFATFLELVSHPLRFSVGGCRIHSFSLRR